jgi:hypothetical protein
MWCTCVRVIRQLSRLLRSCMCIQWMLSALVRKPPTLPTRAALRRRLPSGIRVYLCVTDVCRQKSTLRGHQPHPERPLSSAGVGSAHRGIHRSGHRGRGLLLFLHLKAGSSVAESCRRDGVLGETSKQSVGEGNAGSLECPLKGGGRHPPCRPSGSCR